MESFAKIKPDEQICFQFGIEPLAGEQKEVQKWLADGKAFRDKLVRREGKPEPKPMLQEAAALLFEGKIPGQVEKKEEGFPPEMKLTPGEKDIVTAIERKMSKALFKTDIRFIYLGKKGIWFKPNFRLAFSFFSQFETMNMNSIFPTGDTITKIHNHWFLPVNMLIPRRSYVRRRRLLRQYMDRQTPYFPKSGGTFIMNSEEIASLYHFPSWIVAPVPGVSRVLAKKGPAPDLLNK